MPILFCRNHRYTFLSQCLFIAITEILFCRNHRKDRFDEPAACFRLDEQANLPVDHPFPKLAVRKLFVGSTTLVNNIPKNP